jgi:hypothetical protein
MFLVRVSGGLGNQLFQIAFAFYLRETTKGIVKLDLSFYNDQYNFLYGRYLKSRKIEKRKFEFLNNCPFECCNKKELSLITLGLNDNNKKVNSAFVNFFTILASAFSWTLLFNIFSKNVINDSNFKTKIYYTKSKIFFGYWQDRRFYTELENFIKISLHNSLYNVNPNYFDIKTKYNLNEYIVLHVRKGDYSFLNKYFDLDIVYYKNALLHIQNFIPNIKNILIITNDTTWCVNNLKFEEYNIEFSNSNLYFDFSLMSNAKYIITSNSTFCFWAVFLGNPIIAIQPNLWYIDKEFGYIPDSWHLINCLK